MAELQVRQHDQVFTVPSVGHVCHTYNDLQCSIPVSRTPTSRSINSFSSVVNSWSDMYVNILIEKQTFEKYFTERVKVVVNVMFNNFSPNIFQILLKLVIF